MEVTKELNSHITDKILYHQKLLKQNVAVERYIECAKHRDEITRLTEMLEKE
jgi:protein-arginine kinase activator protein McsA